jgi:hypothetical protein
MRKRVTGSNFKGSLPRDRSWLDLEELAQVEVTSEDPAFPIESALALGTGRSWHASDPGEQTILLMFNQPQRLRRICLRFVEGHAVRTQQFTLSWSVESGGRFQEIVRQQWNFSPGGSTEEREDYEVDLNAVSVLKLQIDPDVGLGKARATLSELRLA